jgi:hypothetical protein
VISLEFVWPKKILNGHKIFIADVNIFQKAMVFFGFLIWLFSAGKWKLNWKRFNGIYFWLWLLGQLIFWVFQLLIEVFFGQFESSDQFAIVSNFSQFIHALLVKLEKVSLISQASVSFIDELKMVNVPAWQPALNLLNLGDSGWPQRLIETFCEHDFVDLE